MPFNASGIYVAVSGATSAAPGQTIKSATWDNINNDVGGALSTLGQASPAVNVRNVTVSSSAITVAATDNLIFISANTPTINLPLASLKTGPVRILGAVTGIFSTNNSVVTPTGGQTISGQASITLNTSFQAATFTPFAFASGSFGWING